MFHKGLWYQNYKQTKMVVWMLLVLFMIHLPFQAIMTLESWRTRQTQLRLQFPIQPFEFYIYEIYNLFFQGMFAFIVMFVIIFLACLLIGVERNTRRMDFSFSLPFARKDIFLAKWLYGACIITVFHSVNFFVAYFIFMQSEFGSELANFTLLELFVGPLLGFLFIFSFALLIGTFTGEMISQIALTFIFGIFPLGLYFLVAALIDVHGGHYPSQPDWVENITIFYHVFSHINTSFVDLLYPIIGIILFAGIGVVLYELNKVEHNGEFLIFKGLHPLFLVGITLCFSLLGGIIVSSLAPYDATTLRIITYWIGFAIFLFFSYLITKRLLQMNLMVKNK
ncbi:ABC transporter permease subunit [Evansella sp. AB-rgal1]|uniref:ABC transporter permease subunit n=1 Tax=Evansella sp. AB-rgal1 TaxID=3242696 RepID=UPI00359D68D8